MIDPIFLTLDHVLQLNKRTALLATLVFLGLNGFEIDRDDQRLDDTVLAVAVGTFTREDASRVLREVARAT